MGGNKHSDELHLMAERLNVKDFFCEFNVVDNFGLQELLLIYLSVKSQNILKKIILLNQLN